MSKNPTHIYIVPQNNYGARTAVLLVFLFSFCPFLVAQPRLDAESFRKLTTTEQRLDFLVDSNIIKFDKPTYEAILPIIEAEKDAQTAFFWHLQYMRFAQQFKVFNAEMFPKILENMTKVAEKGGLEVELVVAQCHTAFNNFMSNRLSEQQAYSVFLHCFEQIRGLGMDKFKRYDLLQILQTIGGNFYALGDYEKTLECLLEGEKHAESGRPHIKTMLLNTIECAYADTKKYPEAIAYAQKIIDLNLNSTYNADQTWYAIFWQGLASLDIAQYMFEMGNFKEGEKYAERGYALYKAQEDLNDSEKTVAAFDALQVLIKIKLQLGKIDESEPLLKKVEFLKSKIDFSHEVNYFKPLRFYNNYYKYYEAQKDYTNAFRYMKLANEMQDSLNRRNDKRKLWQIESRVKADSYLSQIKLAEDESRLQQQLRNAAILLMLFVVFIAYIVYLRIKRDNEIITQQKTQLEESLAEKETLLKEIHHRVKNNLQIISGLLEKQALKTNDALTKRLMKEGQDRVFSMALVHQNLYQSDNLNEIEIKSYLEMLTKHIRQSHELKDQTITLTMDVDDSTVNIDTAIPLGLILNELITNSYKYAFKGRQSGEINIVFHQTGNQLYLSVKDNGIGLPIDFDVQKTRTLGMNLVRGLVRQLNGTLHFASNTEGSLFEITCKL
jgi:two-component sensor histidine kinase